MDLLLLLAAMIGAPLVIVGGVQLLIWKLIGAKALLLFASITFVASAILLAAEAFSPVTFGNRSGLVALSSLTVAFVMVESLLVLLAPLKRRFIAWETAHASDTSV